MESLPEDCLVHILSFASAIAACRVSVVSSPMKSVADSDIVWESFLPPDYHDILSRMVTPLVYSSYKDLFLKLCVPRLIDGGHKIFQLHKSSKKQYTLSARKFSITWASNPLYWTWKSFSQSRFKEVVELRTICWLEINAKIKTKMLSPKTYYSAYLIVKFATRAYGLDNLPSQVSLQVGDTLKSKGSVYLTCDKSKKPQVEDYFYYYNNNRVEALRWRKDIDRGNVGVACDRGDGWYEIKMGSFYNDDGDDKEVKMELKEVTGEHLKGGLIVEGIELRPK
ncbi:hypothetical protein ACFE04_029026 [Oxalis oulophora]